MARLEVESRPDRVASQVSGTHMIMLNVFIAVSVFVTWTVAVGPVPYLRITQEHWPVALTMAVGSVVGGGTSEGGGAIGFPVLTKVLHVPADQARLFTFAIQSLGMSTASLSILLCRVPIELRALRYGGTAAVVGAVISVLVVAPLIPLPVVRVAFTMVLASLGIALIVQLRQSEFSRNLAIPMWRARERVLLVSVGLLGGVFSGMAGVGENTVMFMLLVLVFRVCEKVATPTTVVLMSLVSVTCFLTHVLVRRDFVPPVSDYWIAAVPVVVVGGPLGAYLCTLLKPASIRWILLALICVELVSTLVLIRFTATLAAVSVVVLVVATAVCYCCARSTTYQRGTHE